MKTGFVRSHYFPLFLGGFLFLDNSFLIAKSLFVFSIIVLFYTKLLRVVFDENFFALWLFCGIYFFVYSYSGIQVAQFNNLILILPPCLYAVGSVFGRKTDNSNEFVDSLWVVGLLIASETLYVVTLSIFSEGFAGGGRNIAVSESAEEISATVLAASLLVVLTYGGVVAASYKLLSRARVLLFFSFFIYASLVGLRLGSRTSLTISIFSIVIGLYFVRPRLGFYKIAFIICVLYVFYYFAANSSDLVILSYLQDRIDSSEFGLASGGGRLEKWVDAFAMLPSSPFGWDFELTSYAHNFWLDVARNAGWGGLLLALLVTVLASKSIISSLKRNYADCLYTTAIRCVAVGFLTLFMVEPITDGFVKILSAFCFFWGAAHGFRPRFLMAKINHCSNCCGDKVLI